MAKNTDSDIKCLRVIFKRVYRETVVLVVSKRVWVLLLFLFQCAVNRCLQNKLLKY